MYWLVISASWGTIKLFMAKSSVKVDESNWTFGQILPAFLLLGPFVTMIEMVFETQTREPAHIPTSTRSDAADADGSSPQDEPSLQDELNLQDDPHELEEARPPSQSWEQQEMRRFNQCLENCLSRDYYDLEMCPWILLAVSLVCKQILMVSILMCLDLAVSRSGATAVFRHYAVNVLLAPPAISQAFHFCCLSLESSSKWKKRWIYWCFVFAVFVPPVLYNTTLTTARILECLSATSVFSFIQLWAVI